MRWQPIPVFLLVVGTVSFLYALIGGPYAFRKTRRHWPNARPIAIAMSVTFGSLGVSQLAAGLMQLAPRGPLQDAALWAMVISAFAALIGAGAWGILFSRIGGI